MKLIPLCVFGVLVFLGDANGTTGLEFWGELVKATGIVGICAFVLIRLEPRLRGVEAAIDRLARMIVILLGQLPHVIEAVRIQCADMTKELDAAAVARGETLK